MFFDNNATTPVLPEVADAVYKALSMYGNPSSSYAPGRKARRAIDKARSSMNRNLGIGPGGALLFTSSATEANNICLRGYAAKHNNPHIITTVIEHAAVFETVKDLERLNLCTATYLSVDTDGHISIKELKRVLKQHHQNGKVLVAVITANNEIGTIQDMKKIATICSRYPHVHLHADVTQQVGKYRVHLGNMQVDSACFSGHKFFAPKGIGGLYLRDPESVHPVVTGGMQEMNMRAGTENVAFIVGMDLALQLSMKYISEGGMKRVKALRDFIQASLVENIPNARINVQGSRRLYNTLSISVPSCNSRNIVAELDKYGVYLNVGSACSKGKRSRVLEAIRLQESYEQGTFRISLSFLTTRKECEALVAVLSRVVLRSVDH